MLSDPLVQAGDSWTLRRVDHLLPSREGQGKGKWEFASNASRVFLLICHNITPDQFGINYLKKKIKIQNGILGKVLICKSMYQKLKGYTSAAIGNEFSSQLRRKFSRIKPNWIRNVPNLGKKAEALTCGAQFSMHRHWKQGKILNRTSLVWLYHTNVTKEHKSLNVSHQWRYPYQNLSL